MEEYRDGKSYTQLIHESLGEEYPDTEDPRVLAWLIRRHGVEMTHISRGSHIGSILSVAEIIAVLYACELRTRPGDPAWPERDRLILSKGHAGAAVYAALAERGFFPVEELRQHYGNGSRLSGHVSHHGVPGIEVSTGSLGHGLSIGTGMAYGARLSGEAWRTYVVLGDGECDEGMVWEAALQARQWELASLTAIIDHNGMQSLDECERTLKLEPLHEKWASFGWHVQRVNGHDTEALKRALGSARAEKRLPSVIIADTVKGRGISFMENNILWHYRTPQGEEYEAACRELEANRP